MNTHKIPLPLPPSHCNLRAESAHSVQAAAPQRQPRRFSNKSSAAIAEVLILLILCHCVLYNAFSCGWYKSCFYWSDCFTISIHEALLHSQERLTDRRVRGEEKKFINVCLEVLYPIRQSHAWPCFLVSVHMMFPSIRYTQWWDNATLIWKTLYVSHVV